MFGSITGDRWTRPQLALRPRLRFNSEPVVDGTPKFLLASEVTLRGLDRHVPEQESNLVQFATGEVTELSAGATQIVWSEPLNACASSSIFEPKSGSWPVRLAVETANLASTF